MGDALMVLLRWLHIASVVTLIGGMLFAGLAMGPALALIPAETRDKFSARVASRYRPLVLAAICCLLFSGIANLLLNRGHHLIYHILLGVKLLLVAHIFAVAFLVVNPDQTAEKRTRLMKGAAFSGLAIIAISAYLRYHY